jgi:transposase
MLALRSIARRVLQLTAEERELAREIETLTRKLAPQLLDQPGVGPHAAAQLVLSWSHRGRIESEAAFARLAGAAPIPASSGQTVRYRLDRSGDRKLNRALHMILITRKRSHPATIAYIQRRIQEGKARHDAKPTDASSATSPAASTDSSNTDRHWRLDRHRSITGARERAARATMCA